MGWHVPSLFHDDTPALAILSALLTGGRSARLQHRLVLDDQTATFVSTSRGPGDRYPNLFTIDATPRAPHGTDDLERAIRSELQRIADEPPSLAEVRRVQIQVESGRVRRLRSNLGLAFQLASSASALGDWRATFELADRLSQVTPSDVQRVAARYFTDQNLTVAVLVAAESPPSARVPDPEGVKR
jgi:predicted Zn-dependent peptidase